MRKRNPIVTGLKGYAVIHDGRTLVDASQWRAVLKQRCLKVACDDCKIVRVEIREVKRKGKR